MRAMLFAAAAAALAPAVVRAQQPPAPPAPAPAPAVGSYFTAPPADGAAGPGCAPAVRDAMAAADVLTGPQIWGGAEYLVWFVKNQPTPPLIEVLPPAQSVITTTPTATANAREFQVYPGNQGSLKFDAQNGVRGTVGVQFQPSLGMDFSGFYLERKGDGASYAGTGLPGTPGVARGYIQAGTGNVIHLFSALPGQYSGRVDAAADTQLWGLDGNVRIDWYRFLVDKCDLLVGFRYLDLQEGLTIDDQSTLPDGTGLATHDSFRTRNQFYGGQTGLHAQLGGYGRLWMDGLFKVALGGVHQRVDVVGSNDVIINGALDRETGGLYARGANLGTYTRDKFAAVGELGFRIGYQITPNLRAHVGYNIIWLSAAARPGQAIDPTVNDTNVRFIANPTNNQSNAQSPAFSWTRASGDFWAQGLTLGVTGSY